MSMLGGRAAEEIVFGDRTTGAESDIEQATQLSRRMVTRWGMSDRLGMVQSCTKLTSVTELRYCANGWADCGEQMSL